MDTPSASIDKETLDKLLRGLRELPPKVRTGTRRELRQLGQPVLQAQKAILDGPLPKGFAKVGTKLKLVQQKVRGKGTGKFFLVKKNVYDVADVKRPGRSTGLRSRVKDALKFRIVSGAKRQGLEFQGPRASDGPNGGMFWNAKRFRHPVFGTGKWVYQAGQPFFRAPVIAGRDELLKGVEDVIESATQKL